MKLTQERIDAIMARYHPDGWWLIEHKSLKNNGSATLEDKVIKAPRATTACTLLVYLHECAHVHLRHLEEGRRVPLHRQEYEAERWAMEIARQNGVNVPQRYITEARVYVRSCIAKDRKSKLAIAPHVELWAGR